jgi:hypothetical protein
LKRKHCTEAFHVTKRAEHTGKTANITVKTDNKSANNKRIVF